MAIASGAPQRGDATRPGTSPRRYLLPLLLPLSLWVLAAITLHFYGAKLFTFQATIASIALPVLIAVFALMTSHFVVVARRKWLGKRKVRRPTRVAQVAFTVLILLFNGIFVYLIVPHLAAIRFASGPSLTWATGQDPATGISITWKTGDPMPTRAYLGTDPGALAEHVAPGDPVAWHQIAIDGLAPDTVYYYRVPDVRGDELFSFRTAPQGPANFSFLFFADARQNDGEFVVPILPNVPLHMDTYIKDNDLDVVFTVMGGDLTGEGDNIATWKTWFDDISVSSALATDRPMAIVAGNHERHNDPTGDMLRTVYPLQDRPNHYYSFNYTSLLHVAVLDPWNATTGWWGDIDPAQLAWLEADLASAAGMPYTIACMHPPPVQRDGSAPGSMAVLTTLFTTHGVDAVFFGHDHDYAVNLVNGTWYFLMGVGGNLAHFRNGSGFARVDVSPAGMVVSMHWLNGTGDVLCTIAP